VAPLTHEPDVELTQVQLKEYAIKIEQVALLGSKPDLLLLGFQSQHLLRRLGQLMTRAKRKETWSVQRVGAPEELDIHGRACWNAIGVVVVVVGVALLVVCI
jgi:hypothetical protein